MPRRDAATLRSTANALLTDAGADYGILPSQHLALYIDVVDTLLNGQADNRVLRSDGTDVSWGEIIGEMLSNGIQNGLFGTPSIDGRTITFPVEGNRDDPTLELPAATAAEVGDALAAMTDVQARTARGHLNAFGAVFYSSVPNDAALGTITTAVAQDNRTAIFIATAAFTTTNSRVAATDRTIAEHDVFAWGITASDSTLRWRRILAAGTYAQAGGGGSGLAAVSSDSTLDGAGTASSPLMVAHPFTEADGTKLDGIADGANVGLTSVAIDATLGGDGTVGSPLGVTRPFTAAASSKLAGIANGANVGLTSVATDETIDGDGTAGSPLKVALTEHQQEVFNAFMGSDAWVQTTGTPATTPYLGQISSATNFTGIPNTAYGLTFPESFYRQNRFYVVRVPLALEGRLSRYRLRVGDSDDHPADNVIDLAEHAVLIVNGRDANYAYYSVSVTDKPAGETIYIDQFDPFRVDRNRLDVRTTDLSDTPDGYGAVDSVLAVNAQRNGYIPRAIADLTAGRGELDEGPTRTITLNNLGPLWQTPPGPFNIPENVTYRVEATTATGTYATILPADAWRRLAADAAGQPSGGGADTFALPIGTDEVRFGRTSAQTGLFAKSGAAANITIRITEIKAVSGISAAALPNAVHAVPAANVVLNAPAAAYTWGATFTELWRYTATDADDHRQFNLNPLFEVGWAATSGDRAGVQIKITTRDSTGTLINTLVEEQDVYLRNIDDQLGHILAANLGALADLDAGDYLLVEGRALRQTANAGTITLLAARSRIQHAPRYGSGVAASAQQVESSVQANAFERTYWRRSPAGITPSGTGITFNGQRIDLAGWSASIPSGTDPLYSAHVIFYRAPGSSRGWGTSTAVIAEDHLEFSVGPPFNWHPVYVQNTDTWWRYVPATGAPGPPIALNPDTDLGWNSPIHNGFWPTARSSSLRAGLVAPLDIAAISDAQLVLGIYAIGGSVLTHEMPLDIDTDVLRVRDRTDTPSAGASRYLLSLDARGDTPKAALTRGTDTAHNFGAGQYAVFACNVEFQRAQGVTTGNLIDSIYISNPSSWDLMRRYRVEISFRYR